MRLTSLPRSEREQQVIELLIQGKSNKQIALALGISVRAVEFHLSNIYTKLGVTSRTEAALKLSEMRLRESTSGDLRESTATGMAETADNGEKFSQRRILMKKPLIVLGSIGLGIALILTVLSVFLLLNVPATGVEDEHVATANIPSEILSTPVASATILVKGPLGMNVTPGPIIPPPPTPPNVLGGGTVFDGHFVFDLRLYRDTRFNQHPVTPSLYSDMEGIAAWMYWFYAGADTMGPVETYWGTLHQLDQLIQETYDSIQLGSSGGRNGGVMLPGGFYIPGESKAGDRVQIALKVVTPEGEYGGVLAFTLKQGTNGFEPSDISVDVMQPTPESYVIVDVMMNVRNGPGTEFDVIGQIAPQKKYSVIGKHVDWWLVDLGNNQSAWVYAPINETRFVGNANAVPDIASPATPTPIIIPACTPANTTETLSKGLEKARNALVSFFELLNHREYEKAAALYGGDYQGLQDSNPLLDPQDHVALLTNGCEINGLQCLQVKRIVDEKVASLAEYHFTIEFMNEDGSLFVLGPCCGGNATDFPPESQFAYTVIRNCDGEFLVRELPVYVP